VRLLVARERGHLAQRGAHLIGDGAADILHSSRVDLDNLAEQHDALFARRKRERLERAPRGCYRLVDVRGGAKSDPRPQ
jgi:hypothetical protein